MSKLSRRDDPYREGPDAAHARRVRSLGIAVALVAFAALVFVVTLMRLGGRG